MSFALVTLGYLEVAPGFNNCLALFIELFNWIKTNTAI